MSGTSKSTAAASAATPAARPMDLHGHGKALADHGAGLKGHGAGLKDHGAGLAAAAYAGGANILFAPGVAGAAALAGHEVAHVVQQREGRVPRAGRG